MAGIVRGTILGSGTSSGVPVIGCQCATCRSGDTRDTRLRASMMLETNGTRILIDTSNDFRAQMLGHGVRSLDAILYTHHHFDHISGFDDIRAFNYISGKPMDCYATEPTIRYIQHVFSYAFKTVVPPGGGVPLITMHVIEPAKPFAAAGVEIMPIPLKHGTLDVMGFRLGSVAYCTDCNAIPEQSLPLFHGVDVLILDALRYKPHPTHFTLDEAIAVARRIGARRTYFTHIAHEIKHADAEPLLPESIRIAYDGFTFECTTG